MHFHFYLYGEEMPELDYQIYILPNGESLFEPEYMLLDTVNVVVEAGDCAEEDPTMMQVTAFYLFLLKHPGSQVTFHWQE